MHFASLFNLLIQDRYDQGAVRSWLDCADAFSLVRFRLSPFYRTNVVLALPTRKNRRSTILTYYACDPCETLADFDKDERPGGIPPTRPELRRIGGILSPFHDVYVLGR